MRPQRPSNSPHGTDARYRAGCSCLPCCEAHAEWIRDQRAGQGNPWVSSREAAKHVRSLKRSGMTLLAISQSAAVSRRVVSDLRCGYRPRIRQSTADAILGVRASTARQVGRSCMTMDAAAFDRSLAETGMAVDTVAVTAGISSTVLASLRDGSKLVTEDTADRIARALGARTSALFVRQEVAA